MVPGLGRWPLEKEMATHSSILAWRIPWTEETDELQSMGSQRVRHDLVTKQQFMRNTVHELKRRCHSSDHAETCQGDLKAVHLCDCLQCDRFSHQS